MAAWRCAGIGLILWLEMLKPLFCFGSASRVRQLYRNLHRDGQDILTRHEHIEFTTISSAGCLVFPSHAVGGQILHHYEPWETTVCWHLQGNQHRVSVVRNGFHPTLSQADQGPEPRLIGQGSCSSHHIDSDVAKDYQGVCCVPTHHSYIRAFLIIHSFIPTFIPLHIHAYIQSLIHTFITSYIHTSIHTLHIRTYLPAYLHTYTYKHMYMHARLTSMRACVRACVRPCMRACMHVDRSAAHANWCRLKNLRSDEDRSYKSSRTAKNGS